MSFRSFEVMLNAFELEDNSEYSTRISGGGGLCLADLCYYPGREVSAGPHAENVGTGDSSLLPPSMFCRLHSRYIFKDKSLH